MSIFQKFVIRSLKENKVRTCVTIIGIVLSVSMLTAVMTGISSFQDFMLRLITQEQGCWHTQFVELKEEGFAQLKEDEEIEKYGVLKNVGYAKLENPLYEMCPYLYVGAYEKDFISLTGEQVIKGREPENSGEIMIPSCLLENEGLDYQIGDTLTLTLGERRTEEGEILWQSVQYEELVLEEDGNKMGEEIFTEIGQKTFTIVGIYQGGQTDGLHWSGYHLLTKSDDDIVAESMDLYATLKHPKQTEEFTEAWAQKLVSEKNSLLYTTSWNTDYLIFSGNANDDATVLMMFGMVTILIGIIMLGSISLIYNSFSISINERKKQFGLLSSIGATRKQLRKSVLFEAFVLSVIGIPLGVLAGIGGMALTFQLLSGTFQRFIDVEGAQTMTLQLHASIFAVFLAVVVGFVTVLLSAWLPAQKALKLSTIEALRQSDDIKIKGKKLKTSKLTEKLFGLEGVLAIKNFKRNKKKYQATVFSLFISIVLFISASSFCDYLAAGLGDIVTYYDSDIQYSTIMENAEEKVYPELKKVNGVTKSACYESLEYFQMIVTGDMLSDEFLEYQHRITDKEAIKSEEFTVWGTIVTMEDEQYKEYLKELGVDSSIYLNREKPTAVVVDKNRDYLTAIEKTITFSVLAEGNKSVQSLWYNEDKFKQKIQKEGYAIDDRRSVDENGKIRFELLKQEEDNEKSVYVKPEELYDRKEIQLGVMTQKAPAGAEMLTETGILLIYPKSFQNLVSSGQQVDTLMAFWAEDPDATYREMLEVMKKYPKEASNLYNVFNEIQINKGIVTVIRVFSFGFITLISLIAMANVFNTISTNVALRRREFAMLRSVGMTQKGFYKMMNIECLRYGLLGIGFGVPVAIAITFLIYWVVSEGVVMEFYVPWYSILIAVGSVFLVVFATMLYSMNKIKKDNVVETLRNDVA